MKGTKTSAERETLPLMKLIVLSERVFIYKFGMGDIYYILMLHFFNTDKDVYLIKGSAIMISYMFVETV
jgi:hypothetical protein